MKIANRILNILVLLLALGAATGSFFLFQKREQITKGRQMMSEAVVKTVKTIDPAAKISVEEMSIAKPAADLAAPLKVLEDNTKKIVDQRNKIAAAVAEISNAVMGWSGDKAKKGEEFADYAATTPPPPPAEEAADPKAPADSKAPADPKAPANPKAAPAPKAPAAPVETLLEQNTKMVVARGKYYIDRNLKVQNGINRLVDALKGKRISPADFTPDGDKNNQKLVANFDALLARARMFVHRYNSFETHLSKVAKALKFKTKPALSHSLSNGVFDKNLKVHMAYTRAFAEEKEKLEKENSKLKTEIKDLNDQIADLTKQLRNEQKKVADRSNQLEKARKEIDRLKDIIDPTWREREGRKGDKIVVKDETPLLRKLRGKVTHVNEKFGFVTVNLGQNNEFEDIKIDVDTGKQVPTKRKVGIPTDAVMTVATSLEPGKADYVCRLVVLRVGKDATIANIVANGGSRMPKVGDIVFFSESDVKQMKEIRNAAKSDKSDSAASAKSAEDALLDM